MEVEQEGTAEPQGDRDVQRKVHLFQAVSIRQTIKRFWDILPKNDQGMLPMAGYVDINVRLQKCLTSEFELELAIESAIGDWHEDIKEGQESMTPEDFAMFLFELCSLWCHTNVSLGVYLFFLNASFLAVTQAKGTHTVSLKQIGDVQFMPSSFFDLLHVQQEIDTSQAEEELDDQQAFGIWYLRNFGREQETLLLVQRQVFTVTHDARSVLLFKADGPRKEADVLDLVKRANIDLHKVFPIAGHALGAAASGSQQYQKALSAPGAPGLKADEVFPRVWWPQNHDQPPRRAPRQPDASSAKGQKNATRDLGMLMPRPDSREPATSRSAPAANQSSGKTLQSQDSAPKGPSFRGAQGSPRRLMANASGSTASQGRAFIKAESNRQISGLVLAGKKAVGGDEEALQLKMQSPSGMESPGYMGSPHLGPTLGGQTLGMQGGQFGVDTLSDRPFELLVQEPTSPSDKGFMESKPAKTAEGTTAMAEMVRGAAGNYVTEPPYSQPYSLPQDPGSLYKKQTEAMLRVKPGDVCFAVNLQARAPQPKEARFERILSKLEEKGVRPPPQGPAVGPMEHPNEPIWFEMNHRLHVTLTKVRKRVERRRKRKLRSKLFRGRSIRGQQTDAGQELRQYLDECKAEHEASGGDPLRSEFLAKVHERYLLQREGMQQQPFRVRGTSSGNHHPRQIGIGDVPERPKRAVRPVYVPPPASTMPR
eukprot:gnl/MRDRNA2_/MRDRNA2_97227_c0_seq1.p1 gnl/MRDRNA2_/MRDRNA2_97227_c0~~gnl/MRDRNA2_/MRDRNA2_97227_c0_seq1.p1  ORF type:complete len:708 (-),score=133.16 gnl/MRDRNA2_/MRDRNA2_97227_c0_seq1:168-2291(-)